MAGGLEAMLAEDYAHRLRRETLNIGGEKSTEGMAGVQSVWVET